MYQGDIVDGTDDIREMIFEGAWIIEYMLSHFTANCLKAFCPVQLYFTLSFLIICPKYIALVMRSVYPWRNLKPKYTLN